MGHVLPRKLKPDRKSSKLLHLAKGQAERHPPDVAILVRLPVGQNVAGITDAPAIGQEVSYNRLKIHLVCVVTAGGFQDPSIIEGGVSFGQ